MGKKYPGLLKISGFCELIDQEGGNGQWMWYIETVISSMQYRAVQFIQFSVVQCKSLVR